MAGFRLAGSLPRSSLSWALATVGADRSQLVWRFYGLAVMLLGLMKFLVREPWAYWAHFPGSFHLLVFSGLLLFFLGPRPLLLITAALSAPLAWWSVVLRTEISLWFPAAEWPLLAGYPLAGCAAILVTLRGGSLDHERFDRVASLAVRILGGVGLLAAALHKVNSDFLDPAVSCAHLREGLLGWWRVPFWLLEHITPESILAMELGGALMLWLTPRIGCVLVSLLLLHFGSIGATAFAGLILLAALAGLPAGTLAIARRAWGRWRWFLLAGLAVLLPLSAWIYQGPRPWSQFALFHTAVLAAVGLGVVSLGLPRRQTGNAPMRWRARIFLGALAVAAVFNAARPYLGLGFQYSFAMLSNLRVDSNRWNSLLIPRPGFLETDGYMHVYGVRYFPKTLDPPPILPALHSPGGLKRKLAPLLRDGYWVGLDFEYRERRYSFSDGQRRELLSALLLSMPDGPLLQDELVLDGPQLCVH